MSLRESIVKAIGEAAGKFATEIQAEAFSAFRGLVWKQANITSVSHNILTHLFEFGSVLYQGRKFNLAWASCNSMLWPEDCWFLYRGTPLRVYAEKEYTYMCYPFNFDLQNFIGRVRKPVPAALVSGVQDGKFFHTEYSIPKKKLFLNKEARALEDDLHRWLLGERIFKSLGLPHRRGWLLYGKPGNGKSTVIQQLAHKYDMDICVPSFTKEGIKVFPKAKRKFFLLFEDFDLMFRGREALKPEANFGAFLNVIDGVVDLQDCVVVITTNDLSAIDSAVGRPKDETQWNSLSTRPGRIDRCVYFDNPDSETRQGIAAILLSEDEAIKLASETEGFSVAQVAALAREKAMEMLSLSVTEGNFTRLSQPEEDIDPRGE